MAIIRELALAPGETFDLIRMETSEARLRNTRFFEKVTLDDEPITSQDPELVNSRRNLVVNVEEGRTGHVSFGVGFSTLEKAMMFAEFRQGNFDLMRWRSPHRLQGDGQKFRLRLKLGARSNEAVLALEEPWFLNRRVAAGFELFRQKSDYYSSYYDELRAGFEIYFRKRLFELVEGRLFYRLEDVVIDDLSSSPSRPSFIKEEDLTISKLGFSLTRDTRDSILFPSEGSIVTLRKEFAGGPFGGDADYGRFELQGARFFQTFDAMEQVLTLSGRTGTLGRFDGKDSGVPFFEKFFLADLITSEVGITAKQALKTHWQVNLLVGTLTVTSVRSTRSKWRIRCALLFSTTGASCGRAISNLFQETDCRDGMTIGV